MSSCRAAVWTVIRADKRSVWRDSNESHGFITLLEWIFYRTFIKLFLSFYRGKLFCDNYRYRIIAQPYIDVTVCDVAKDYSILMMRWGLNYSWDCVFLSNEKTILLIIHNSMSWFRMTDTSDCEIAYIKWETRIHGSKEIICFCFVRVQHKRDLFTSRV